MTLKQIRAFLAVAQSLSFAVAGERLHLSQSALSLTIKALKKASVAACSAATPVTWR